MTGRRGVSASERGLDPHYKMRIVVGGGVLYAASRTEPKLDPDDIGLGVEADWIEDGAYGDTIGFIDWSAVTAVTWRWSK